MSLNTDTAQEYIRLADKSIDRGNIREALHYLDEAQALLLRQSPNVEAPGTVVGERFNYSHLGKVLAEKAKLRLS